MVKLGLLSEHVTYKNMLCYLFASSLFHRLHSNDLGESAQVCFPSRKTRTPLKRHLNAEPLKSSELLVLTLPSQGTPEHTTQHAM